MITIVKIISQYIKLKKYGVPFLETLNDQNRYHLYDESDRANNDLNSAII